MTLDQGRRRTVVTPQGALLALVLVGLLFSSVYPIKRYFAVRATTAALEREEEALQARLDVLSSERDKLTTDAEVERLAREQLGMIRPGEVPFVIATPKPAPSSVAVSGSEGFDLPGRDRTPSVLDRWWNAVRRAAGALG